MDPDNPLADTAELSTDGLMDRYLEAEITVDELRAALDAEDYNLTQVQVLKDAEEASEERKTAIDAINEEIDRLQAEQEQEDQTQEDAGDYEPLNADDEEDNDPVEQISPLDDDQEERVPRSARRAGVTEAGVEEIELPSPYSEDAPATLEIVIPRAMGFGGRMFDTGGVYAVPYREPNGSEIRGVQFKQNLEATTNPVVLSDDDPLHPSNDDGEDEIAGSLE